MCADVERRRGLVTTTSRGRRPPRLDDTVSLTAETIEKFFAGYGSYKDVLLRGARDVQGEEETKICNTP